MQLLIKEYKNSLNILKSNLTRFIKYQIMTKILLFIILLPLYKYLLSKLIRANGFDYLANGALKNFLVSPQGMFFAVVSIAIGFVVLLMEFGGLIIITQQAIIGEKESAFYEILKKAFSKIKYLLGLDGLIVLIYLFMISPLLDSGSQSSILSKIEIPGFIMDVINSSTIYSLIHFALLVIMLILTIRWMFSLHYLMLCEDEEHKIFKQSSRLVSKHFWTIFKFSIGVLVLHGIVLVAMVVAFLLVGIILFIVVGKTSVFVALIVLFSMGLILVTAVGFIYVPFHMILQTLLFYRLSEMPPSSLEIKASHKRHLVDRILAKKLSWLIITILAVGVVSVTTVVYLEDARYIQYGVDITAHRGDSRDAPENTLVAIEMAIKKGATFVEIDVQETKDGEVILLHDRTLERTTGIEDKPWELNLKEIKNLDAGSWFDEKYSDEKIPTLREVIELTKGKIRLNIEIKGNENMPELEEKVVKIIESERLVDNCVVSSLNLETLEKVESLNHNISTGYIMFVALGDLEEMNVDFYSVEETNVTERFIDDAHALGRQVHVWTINTDESMKSMLDLSVDNIITDNIEELKDIIKEKNEEIDVINLLLNIDEW